MSAHIILGGGGFLGRHLAAGLIGENHKVLVVDRAFFAAPATGVAVCVADVLAMSAGDLADLIAGFDVVHHLVWSTVPAVADAEPERDVSENLGFMLRLLAAVRSLGIRIVFTSSGGTVYGVNNVDALDEGHALSPIGVYGASKAAAEFYANVFRQSHGVDVRIARLSNPYGTGQSTSSLQGAVSRFVVQAMAREPIQIWGTGEVVRDFIHIQDTVHGLMRFAEVERGMLADGATLNIGSGSGHSLNDLIGLLGEIFGTSIETHYYPGRAFDVPRNVLDIDRARRTLSWTPRILLRDGIKRMRDELLAAPGALVARIDPR